MEEIIAHYKNTIGVDLKNLQHPLSAKINSVFSDGSLDQTEIKLHLMHFAVCLFDIREFDNSIYDFYIKKIAKNADNGVLGYIFEANQCAQYIHIAKRENLNFIFGDHNKKEPDFIINGCGFEIKSCRFSDDSDKTRPGKKLLDTFRDKNKKDYAKNDCALVIDISQISYYAQKNKEIDMSLNDVLQTIRAESKFGIVVCIVGFNGNERNIQGTAYQAYSKNCSPILRDLIENKFIKGERTDFKNNPSITYF